MNWMKKTKMLGLVVFMVSMLSFSAAALDNFHFDEVVVDGTEVLNIDGGSVSILAKEKNEEIEVRLEVRYDPANASTADDLKDVQLEAVMRGYDHDDLIQDITSAFDMAPGVTYVKELTLKLPIRMDKDTYKLRLRAEDRSGVTSQTEFDIKVEAKNHALWLKDVVFNPESYVKTGRALLTTVRIENIGEQDEDGIKVRASIPALGVSASDYIDKLDEGDKTTSEELYMRIPACADAGDYDVKVEVIYDDGDETETVTETLTVVEGDVCPDKATGDDDNFQPASTEKTIISYGATSQDVIVGQGGSIYPVTLTNMGSSAKTYSVAVDIPGNWATYQVSPSNVAVVKGGETATMFVYVSAKDNAPAGENAFTVTVSGDGEELDQVLMTANVSGSEETTSSQNGWDKVKKALEIGLVVLVVLLVILGLVIGFQRLKGDDDEGDDMGKTYY